MHGPARLLANFFFRHSKAILSAPQWARLLLRRQFEYKSSSIAFKPFYEDIDPAPVQNVILQANRRKIARMVITGKGGRGLPRDYRIDRYKEGVNTL